MFLKVSISRCSSAGRAGRLGRSGRWFETSHFDNWVWRNRYTRMVQNHVLLRVQVSLPRPIVPGGGTGETR